MSWYVRCSGLGWCSCIFCLLPPQLMLLLPPLVLVCWCLGFGLWCPCSFSLLPIPMYLLCQPSLPPLLMSWYVWCLGLVFFYSFLLTTTNTTTTALLLMRWCLASGFWFMVSLYFFAFYHFLCMCYADCHYLHHHRLMLSLSLFFGVFLVLVILLLSLLGLVRFYFLLF